MTRQRTPKRPTAKAAPVEPVPEKHSGAAALRAVVVRRATPLIVTAIVLLGLGGYVLFIPTTVTHDQLLSRLVPQKTLLPNMTPAPAESLPIPVLPSTLPSVTAAANGDPGHTASYSIQWFGTGETGANEQIILTLVPSVAIAEQLAALQDKQNLTASSITAAKNTLINSFKIPGLAASGAEYSVPRSAQDSSGNPVKLPPITGYTVIARHGRAVVREVALGPTVTRAQAEAIARQVDGILAARLASFPSVASTAYPTTATLLYVIVTALLIVASLFGPRFARRRAEARRIREAERARYQYRVRGAKNLRRHRTPY